MKDKAEMILDSLTDTLSNGWLYFFCARSLDNAYADRKITFSRYFFLGCYYACLNESILALSRLLIDHPDSVSLRTLLDHARENAKSFSLVLPDRLLKVIEDNEAKLDEFDSLSEAIRLNHGKAVVHFDRKHINIPSPTHKIPLDLDEVEDCYREILNILNVFLIYKNMPEFSLINIERSVPQDVDFLVDLMGKSLS